MSNRDSMGIGDLIPQDLAEVFAQERMSKGARRKKRSKSLGRAIDWFKGKKRKDLDANAQNPGLGPGLDLELDGPPAGPQTGQKPGKLSGKPGHSPGGSRAAAKQGEDDKTQAPPQIQENVFVENSRPKYVEDLHNEALEGLKLLQQEETSNGMEFRDDESSISTVISRQDEEGQGFLSDSTMADTSSIVSTQSISSMSSRSGITRQGSTFRPLNSGKKPEKKRHRRHRKTVMGIPQHVQRELGLDRMDWKSNPVLNEELDGIMNSEDASNRVPSVGPNDAEIPSALAESQTSKYHASHRDDLALLSRLDSDMSPRPRSLAVPWATTANNGPHGPPSPVMSINPHAAYMSKIIPNAVMPPSVEVLEIQRGRSRNSLKTVSKSSLLLASPTGSRASSRASSARGPSSRVCSSRASTMSSASQHRANYTSDSSGWSPSESSETLVSDSSTISSSTTPQQKSSADERRVARKSAPLVGNVPKATSNGKTEASFARSLSIMKPKRAPPPPSRSHSLHNRMKRRSRDLSEAKGMSKESSPQSSVCSGKSIVKSKQGEINNAAPPQLLPGVPASPGYTADTSSLDDSNGSVSVSPPKSQLQAPEKGETVKKEEPPAKVTISEMQPQQENGLKKSASPSSGYSSQAGTPNKPSKQTPSSSPKPKRGFFSKIQSLFPGPAPATSHAPQPEAASASPSKSSEPQPGSKVETDGASPSVRVLRELFNIPPPPKIHAPPPPPPEVWAHNKRTFELLLGPPAPDDTFAAVKKNPKDRRQQRPSPSISVKSSSTEGEKKSQISSAELIHGVLSSMVLKKVQESEQSQRENKERLTNVESCEKVKGKSNVTEKEKLLSGSLLVKVTSGEVMEKAHERLVATQEERKTPIPPPAYHPKTRPGLSPTMESLWPPPPPPMDTVTETLLIRQDVTDFPLPPPPLLNEEGLVILDNVPPGEVRLDTSVPRVAVVQGSPNQLIESPKSIHTSVVGTDAPPTLKTNKVVAIAPKQIQPKMKLTPPMPKGFPPPPQSIPPPPPQSIPPPPPFTAPTLPVNLPANPLLSQGFLPTLAEADSECLVCPPQEPPQTDLLPSALKLSPLKSIVPPQETQTTVNALESVPPAPPQTELLPSALKLSPPKSIATPQETQTTVTAPESVPPAPPSVTEILPAPEEAAPSKDNGQAAPDIPAPTPAPNPITMLVKAPPIATEHAPQSVVTNSLPSPPINATPTVTLITKLQEAPPVAKEHDPEFEVTGSLSSPPAPQASTDGSQQHCKETQENQSKEQNATVSTSAVTTVNQPSLKLPPVTKIPEPNTAPDLVLPNVVIEAQQPIESQRVVPKEAPSQPMNTSKVQEPDKTDVVIDAQSLPSIPPLQTPTNSLNQHCKETPENQSKEQNAKIVNKCPGPNKAQELVLKGVVVETQQPTSQGALESEAVVSEPAPSQPVNIGKAQDLVQPDVVIESQLPISQDVPEVVVSKQAPTQPENIPSPSAPAPQVPSNTTEPQTTESKTVDSISSPAQEAGAAAPVTPSHVQPVKQESMDSGSEATKDQCTQDQPEVIMRNQQPKDQLQAQSSSNEAPQKPIRRSLIMISPPSISSPTVVLSQEPAPKSQSADVIHTSAVVPPSPTKRSPPVMTTAPSMNMQEAIRLRTAARAKSPTSPRGPTSPYGGDIRKSPSSMASFVFSKSTRMVGTAPFPEAHLRFQKNGAAGLPAVSKPVKDADPEDKKGVKVPPPVAKKPKAQAKDNVETP